MSLPRALPATDFLPTATWETLRRRAELLRRLRQFFEVLGFVEVETPLLSHDAIIDLHIDPIPVMLCNDPRSPEHGQRLWLQTSPEFAMKRLLVAGAEKIFQVGKAFRGGERGTLHNPEFTMVEWYRIDDSMQQGIDLLADLATAMLGSKQVERLSYETAFQRALNVNPHLASAEELAACARARELVPPSSLGEDRDQWLNYLLAMCVEPELGRDAPTILFDYPASQAALARTRVVDEPPRYSVAERFELYFRGVELANGYHELLDPAILRERNRRNNERRFADGRYLVPEDSRLLAAMEQGLPPCSGVALGFDRLAMLVLGKSKLSDVLAFPIDRA